MRTNMGEYWLLDRHGAEGPSALVETDGSMRVVDVVRFGPAVTSVEAQQQILDDVIGRVAPTLKPMVAATKMAEAGIDLHADLKHGEAGGSNRSGRRIGSSKAAAGGQAASGPKRTGGRGRG